MFGVAIMCLLIGCQGMPEPSFLSRIWQRSGLRPHQCAEVACIAFSRFDGRDDVFYISEIEVLCLVRYLLAGICKRLAEMAGSLLGRLLQAVTQFGRGLYGSTDGRFRLVGYG